MEQAYVALLHHRFCTNICLFVVFLAAQYKGSGYILYGQHLALNSFETGCCCIYICLMQQSRKFMSVYLLLQLLHHGTHC